MKIIDLLSPNQKANINELIKSYGKNNEFEVSLFSNKETSSHLLTLEKFNNLNSILAKVTTKNEEKYASKKTEVLDVIMSIRDSESNTKKITNYRISIEGLESINKYMSMLHVRKNHLVFSVLSSFYMEHKDKKGSNITMMKKTKNISTYVTLEDIYMRFKLDTEEMVSEEELKKLIKLQKYWKPETYTIIYRFKERNSHYVLKDKNIFQMDLTTVKTTNVINNIESSAPNYEIEIESDIKDKNKFLEEIFGIGEFIIKSVQGSNFIITKSMTNLVLERYREILSVDNSKTNLYARQPISLEVQHLVNYLPNKYAVTDKADGDRNYLIIVDNRCYLISTNLIVKDTGLNIDGKLSGSIIDGEFIFLPKYNRYLFMGFDCLYYGDINVREESKFSKRLEYLDQLIYQINKCGYIHKSVFDSKIDFNSLDKIVQFHKKNLIEFYEDIDKELKKKSTSIICRRKYFIEALGTQDNEIFKYTSMIWTMLTSDPELKYPYLNDGLIYHPNEQKYIIDVEKSKYFEYKWKPPTMNSIDLYIVFEKDKLGKILTVYDNSIPDVVKNKPYQIANLYVGLNIKGVEKPVLFGEEQGVSQAYIYLDDSGIPRSQDGKPILDKTVVEFYYNLESDVMNSYRWMPMRTRWDKTESVKKFSKRYGNAQRTANAVWRSITNPILAGDFANLSSDTEYNKFFKQMQNKIDFSIIKQEKKQNIYFQKKTDLVKNMSSFHAWIKSNLIYTYMMYKYNDDIQTKVLDFGCGRGGDIQKFYYTEVELYVGIDPDYDALIDSSDGALARYKNLKKSHERFPPMFFIQSNAGIYLQYDEQIKALGKMNSDMKNNFNKFFTWDNSRTIFDRANCQFAIHYLFSDEYTWNNFCQNLNMYLREGGYFICTTFDGNKIKEKLKGKDRFIEYYDDNGEKKVLFDIVKKYDDNSKNLLGNAIDVHMGWLFEDGVYQTEYLVYPEFIIKSMKEKCSMELVETYTFEDIFNDNKDFLKLSSEIEESIRIKFFKDIYKFYTPTDINKKCYSYSFLNRFYVFRKKETDLSEVKSKYYGSNRKRIIKGPGITTAKAKVFEKKQAMQQAAEKEAEKVKERVKSSSKNYRK
jgi:SAM-dependent methyltransferase